MLSYLVDKEAYDVMYGSFEKVRIYYNERLHIEWPKEGSEYSILKANLIRNCIMHNGGVVDKRLAKEFGLKLGQQIKLSPSEVHGYGIEIREAAYSIYEQALKKHINNA